MQLINEMDNTEIPLAIFNKGNLKYQGCKHLVKVFGQKTCELYNQRLETNMDVLNYCGNCVANTKKPSTYVKVRGP